MSKSTFDFYGKRKIFYIISLCIIALTVVMLFVDGVTLDIQFRGGSIIKYGYEGAVSQDEFSAKAASVLSTPVSVQETQDFTGENKEIVLNVAGNNGLTAEQQEALFNELTAAFPQAKLTVRETFNVDPYYGFEFLQKGILAVSLAVVLIIIYVWFRFRSIHGLSAGVMALVALLHDVVMVFAIFVIFRIPINDAFVAVVLTIIGYSINDTIVIYDRIRENEKIYGTKKPLNELVNISLNQTIVRTVNTSLSTFMAMATVFVVSILFNLASITNFALPMLVGIVSGCYSSLFIATPLWVSWNMRGKKK